MPMARINWVRVTITFTLAALTIFLPIRRLKMNRVFKRVVHYKRLAASVRGAASVVSSSHRARPWPGLASRQGYLTAHQGPRLASVCSSQCANLHVSSQPLRRPLGPVAGPSTTSAMAAAAAAAAARAAGAPNVTYELVRACSALPSLDSFLCSFYKLLISYNWYLLAKHLVVSILRLDLMAHLRYLDCYLVGRFIVNGRVIELASYCACFLLTFILCWYHTTAQKLLCDFKMPCFEFLLMSQDEVARWTSPARASRASLMAEGAADAIREEPEADVGPPAGRAGQDHQGQVHSAIFEYHNPFESRAHSKCYGLRPNRTRESWLALARLTLRFYKIFGFFFAALVVFFVGMLLPVVLNQKGFEYNYRFCIHYITTERIRAAKQAEQQMRPKASAGSRFLSLIRPQRDEYGGALGQVLFFDRPNVTKNFRLKSTMGTDFLQPIRDVVPMNAYHSARIFLDLLDSVVIYFQIAFILACSCHIILVVSADVVRYCSALNARLTSLIHTLRAISSINLNIHQDYYYYTSIKYNEKLPPDTGHHQRQPQHEGQQQQVAARTYPSEGSREHLSRKGARLIQRDTFEIQAMMADMFTLIDWYNKFVSHLMLWLVLFWLGYSALVSSWIFIPGNDSPKTEWFTLHLFATIYVFFIMYQFSAVKSECRRLYGRIVIAMALDESVGTSKANWTSLLKFFTPVPMYCFTMIKSIELNMLFGLKLLAWLFSAIIVASSFFTVNIE